CPTGHRADPPGLVAVTRGFHHRRGRRTGEPEPGTVRPGVVSSLRPHVSVPGAARGAFATASPALVGIWALAGFFLSLGPSLAAQLLHSKNLLWGGILIFPAHRSRGRSLGLARQEESFRGDAR